MTKTFVVIYNGDCYRVFYKEDHSIVQCLRFYNCRASWCDEIEYKDLPREVRLKFEAHLVL